MDIVDSCFEEELTTAQLGWDHPDRDIYFSSKGHDVPGLYAVLALARRHPDGAAAAAAPRSAGSTGTRTSRVPGIEANSGSLGMGISKGRGHGLGQAVPRPRRARRRDDRRRRAAGGPELGGAAGRRARGGREPDRHRRPQRAPVRQADRGDPRPRRPRGEAAARSAGTSTPATGTTTSSCARRSRTSASSPTRPKVLVAHTIKGKGVSFMEHPVALEEGGGTYRWHAVRPTTRRSSARSRELTGRIGERLAAHGLGGLALEPVPPLEEEPRDEPRGRACERGRGAAAEAEGVGRVRRRGVRRGAARSRRAASGAGRPRRRPRLGLPRPRLRARGIPDRFIEVRHRRAGHGLDGRRARAPGAAARRQLVRVLPRLAGERADLQRRQRGRADRLRAATTPA